MNRDLAFGCVGLAVAVVYYLSATAIPESDLADAVGPQGLPHVYAWLLGALSLALMAGSLRHSGFGIRNSGSGTPSPESRVLSPESRVPSPESRVLRSAGIIVIGVLYIAIVPWAGYLLSLAALIAVTAYYQGGALSVRTAFVAISGALVFWLLFVVLLGIDHPAGIWPDLFS